MNTFNISRDIFTNGMFKNEPFTQREAFIWLVSQAAYKPCTRNVGGKEIHLDTGQYCASIRYLSKAWQWSKGRVERFLIVLKNRDTLRIESGTGINLITICNYSEYNYTTNKSETVTGQQSGQSRDKSNKVNKILSKDNIYTPLTPQAKTKGKNASLEIPSNVSPEIWGEFLIMRKEIKKPMTDYAKKRMLKKLQGFGDCANDSMNYSIDKSYQDVYKQDKTDEGKYDKPNNTTPRNTRQHSAVVSGQGTYRDGQKVTLADTISRKLRDKQQAGGYSQQGENLQCPGNKSATECELGESTKTIDATFYTCH